VLINEIGHVLLGAPGHQPHGLMRAKFFSEDLVSLQRTSFTLSAGEQARLLSRKLALGSQGRANVATGGQP
jgi:hypothetical protein